MSHQIRSICDDSAAQSVLTHLSFPASSSFSPLTHTNTNVKPDDYRFHFPRKKQVASHPPLNIVMYRSPVAWLSPTQPLCHGGAEEGSGLEEQPRRSGVGATPGARNVNWEDCFNKALIFADAGRGLAGGATQTGGQLTVRYCQQT